MPMYSYAADNASEYISITTTDDLNSIRNNISANYRLENDLDLTSATSAGGAYYNNGKGWTPIADFKGVFDGNGHTIKGLKISTSSYNSNTGLFGNNNGTIKNLTIEGTLSTIDSMYTAAFAGNNYGTIDSCVNKCKVSVTGSVVSSIGGIAAYNEGEISNCSNYGNISITGLKTSGSYGPVVYVGGLAGHNKGNVDGDNYGSVTGVTVASSSYTGGITGYNEENSPVADSYNEGEILAAVTGSGTSYAQYAGGITGYSKSAISTSSNAGVVTANGDYSSSCAGGICASTVGCDFDKCSNYGAVLAFNKNNKSPGSCAGGIVGKISDGYNYTVYGCVNGAEVNALSAGYATSGGMIGAGVCKVDNCANAGQIASNCSTDSSYYVLSGGIAGHLYENGTIKSSASLGTIFSNGASDYAGDAGGIAGKANENTTISQSYSAGSILGKYYSGGITGLEEGTIKDCYSLCSFDPANTVIFGGIAGFNGDTGIISNVYSNISCSEGFKWGGLLIGTNNGNTSGTLIANNCDDLDTVRSGNATGAIFCSNSMINKDIYSQFDFVDTWEMGTGDYKLPILKNCIGGQNNFKAPDNCSYNDWETTKEPTLEEEGVKERTCKYCGKKETETIERLKPVPPTPVTPATPVTPVTGNTVEVGAKREVSAGTVIVTSVEGETVSFAVAKNAKSVVVPDTVTIEGKQYKVTQIEANAFKGSKIRTITIGKNVKVIKKDAFKGSPATKLILKTKLLKKAKVKGCLKGSKIKTVQVKVGNKAANKKFVKAYKNIFTKANAGKKVSVK